MHNIAFFKQITKLDNENITFTHIEEVKWGEESWGRTKIILTVRWKYTTSLCPYCGQKTSKRKDAQFHESKHNLKHAPYWWDKMAYAQNVLVFGSAQNVLV